jgi:hypothetical protein
LITIIPCTSMSQDDNADNCWKQEDGSCKYNRDEQLRYIVTY